MFGFLKKAKNIRPILEPGQVWSYHTRPGEEDSLLVVLKVEQHPRFGKLAHISLENLHGLIRKHPEWPIALAPMVAHLPCAHDAIAQSVAKLEGRVDAIPDFSEGYRLWSEAVERGEAGVYTVALTQIVDAIEAGRSKFAHHAVHETSSANDGQLTVGASLS